LVKNTAIRRVFRISLLPTPARSRGVDTFSDTCELFSARVASVGCGRRCQ